MSLSTDVASIITASRAALAHGGELRGEQIRLVIDTLETLANTTESKAATAVGALSTALVATLAAWDAIDAADSSTLYTEQEAILTPLRTAAVTAAAATVTNVTVNDSLDGRYVP